MKARLIADGGAAASDPANFFRSTAFLEAEGATHTIEFEDGVSADYDGVVWATGFRIDY